jgi:hypothetical protein
MLSRPDLLVSVLPWLLIPVGIGLLVWVLCAQPRKAGTAKYSSAQALLWSGGEVIQAFPITTPVVTIGRDQPEGIEIFKDSISRSHAQIVNQEGCYWICDMNSTNGTSVNGRKVAKQILRDGDRIGIGGETLVFRAM